MRIVEHFLQTLSWTFVHSLWIGIVISILTGFVVLLTRRSTSSLRYSLFLFLFVAFLTTVFIAFVIEWTSDSTINGYAATEGFALFQHLSVQPPIQSLTGLIEQNAFWITAAWMVIMLIKAGKMAVEMRNVQKLKTKFTSGVDATWRQKIDQLAARLEIRRRVQLLESALTAVPVVAGHFKPVILLPIGLLTQLSPAQLEAILLHELAHIRRHDFLVNFIQRLAGLVFFFNPSLLWLSHLIRKERENCCDDIAVGATGDKAGFVRAMIGFREFAVNQPVYVMGLFSRKSLLLDRVKRLVYNRHQSLTRFEAGFLLLNIVLLGLIVTNIITPKSAADNVAMNWYVAPHQPRARVDAIHRVHPPTNAVVKAVKARQRRAAPTVDVRTISQASMAASSLRDARRAIAAGEQDNAITSSDELFTDISQRRMVAEQHRLQAEKDRAIAEQHRKKSEEDRKEADLHRERAEQYRQQAARDAIKARELRESYEHRRHKILPKDEKPTPIIS